MCRAAENCTLRDSALTENIKPKKERTFPNIHLEFKLTKQNVFEVTSYFCSAMSCKTDPHQQPMQSIQCLFIQTATRLLTSKSLSH